MSKVIRFAEAEVAEPADFDAIGDAAREGHDNIVGGAIGYPSHWAAFTISTPTGTTVRVNEGRYFRNDRIYDLDAPVDLPLQVHLPLVVGDQRYVAILARHVDEVITAQRMIETDVDTGETVQQSIPKIDRRRVELVIQQGLPSPTPIKPDIASGDCALAFVLLSATGVVAVESGEDYRVKTLYEIEGRVRVLEGQMVVSFRRTQTLQSDLANLAGRILSIPRPEVIRQLQRDAARTRRILGIPDEARAYFYDPGLVRDQWDFGHANWLARVREGVRFAFAAERDDRLEVLDEGDEAIRIKDGILLPAWTEATRIEVDGSGSFRNISQQVHTVTTAVERTISRSSVEYGPTVAICENLSEWSQVGEQRVGETFQVNGETFQNLGVITSDTPEVDLSVIQTWNPDVTQAGIVEWNEQAQSAGHQNFAVQQVSHRSWTETYWDYVTETFGVNGSVYAQTFLLSQPMIMTSIDLRFTRVGTTGDVHLSLCEVDATGAPRFDRVIARSTVEANGLSVGWVKFDFAPRYLSAGRRYAWVSVTTGNHALATVTGSVFTQGTLFWSTDESWFQGAPEEDFAFRVNAAEFRSTRTVVEFEPLTLDNGMTQLHLIYENWVPPGTNLVWEWRTSDDPTWRLMLPYPDHPMNGLPALIRLRATFINTTEMAPGISLNAKARGMTQRHRADMTAVSKVLNFGFSTTSIVVETVVDNFDPVHNTVANKLIVGEAVVLPDATTIEADISRPGRFTYTSTFTTSSTASARLRVDMTTDTVILIPFIQNVSLFAL
jgi:hypothetical protein